MSLNSLFCEPYQSYVFHELSRQHQTGATPNPSILECPSLADLRYVVQSVSDSMNLKVLYVDARKIRGMCKKRARSSSTDPSDHLDNILGQVSGLVPCIIVIEGLDDILETLTFSGVEEGESYGEYNELACDLDMFFTSAAGIGRKSKSKARQVILTALSASVSQMNVQVRSVFFEHVTLKTVAEIIHNEPYDDIFNFQIDKRLETNVVFPELRISDPAVNETMIHTARVKGLYLYEFYALWNEVVSTAMKRESTEALATQFCFSLSEGINVDVVLDQALEAFEALEMHEERETVAISSKNSSKMSAAALFQHPIPPQSLADCFREIEISKEDVISTTTNLISFCPSSSAFAKRMSSKNKASRVFECHVSPVRWEDIGGMEAVRKEIMDIFYLPSQYPTLFTKEVPRRRSILLYGPPGTGKTYIARAVATECQMQFISVKGPELLDMYVGESEKNVREVFQFARTCAPSVVFFDELDSLAPARGRGKSGGGVMDRIVSQILAEIDCLNKEDKDVFIIGATNRPDLLDPALLRPGRFDRKIFVTVCTDTESKEAVLKAQTKDYSLESNLDLRLVASELPKMMSGADIAGICRQAYSAALSRTLESFAHTALSEAGKLDVDSIQINVEDSQVSAAISAYIQKLPESDLFIKIREEDFLTACKFAKASISDDELLVYETIGSQFDDTKSWVTTVDDDDPAQLTVAQKIAAIEKKMPNREEILSPQQAGDRLLLINQFESNRDSTASPELKPDTKVPTPLRLAVNLSIFDEAGSSHHDFQQHQIFM